MRNRVAFALFLSLLLVGTATWMRAENSSENPSYSLTEVKNTSPKDDSFSIESFLGIKESKTEGEEVELSKTDIIGRQLILDYVELATSGKATEANITALAEKYAQSMPTILSQTPKVSLFEIKTTSNSKVNLQKYANELAQIHVEYSNHLSSSGGNMQKFVSAYVDASNKLKNMQVPLLLAPSHLKLINSYISSSEALKVSSNPEADSASSFAGMIILNENMTKDAQVMNEISQILLSNAF